MILPNNVTQEQAFCIATSCLQVGSSTEKDSTINSGLSTRWRVSESANMTDYEKTSSKGRLGLPYKTFRAKRSIASSNNSTRELDKFDLDRSQRVFPLLRKPPQRVPTILKDAAMDETPTPSEVTTSGTSSDGERPSSSDGDTMKPISAVKLGLTYPLNFVHYENWPHDMNLMPTKRIHPLLRPSMKLKLLIRNMIGRFYIKREYLRNMWRDLHYEPQLWRAT